MVYTTRIPCDTKVISFTGESNFTAFNTHALDCTVKAVGGSVNIKVSPDAASADVFTLSDGEKLDFSGNIYVSGASGTKLQAILFTTF